MQKWIEVEPGAPLPAEVPPWAERHDQVMCPELSETHQRLALVAGAGALGASAALLFVGNPLGYAGVLPGLVFLYAGWTGGSKHPDFVPSPGGRYVLAEYPDEPVDPAELEKALKRARRSSIVYWGIVVPLFVVLYTLGNFSLRELGTVLLACAAGGIPLAVEAIKRRSRSEAELSERFLQVSDPRHPLSAVALPAGEPDPAALHVASGEGRGAGRIERGDASVRV